MVKGIIMFLLKLCPSSEKKKHADKYNNTYDIGYCDNFCELFPVSADGKEIVECEAAQNNPKKPVNMIAGSKQGYINSHNNKIGNY